MIVALVTALLYCAIAVGVCGAIPGVGGVVLAGLIIVCLTGLSAWCA